MANVFGLSNLRNSNEAKDDQEDVNRMYVGGTSNQGGGSGLSVIAGDSNDGTSMGRIIAQAQSQQNGGASNVPSDARVITFYQDGFTVDDGPFRSLTDPENAPFLKAIENGVVPRELEGEDRSAEVHINLVDKRSEKYVPPPAPAYVAFSGEGQTMGGTGVNAQALIFVSTSDDNAEKPAVDASQPTTTLQIRLQNGTRLRERLNLTHTVRDLSLLIAAAGGATQPYTLMAGFPPQPLTNMDLSIEEAGLKGASITQKLA